MKEHFPSSPSLPSKEPKRQTKKPSFLQRTALAGMLAFGGASTMEGCAPAAQGMHDQTSESARTQQESPEMITFRLFQVYDQPGLTDLLRSTQENLSPSTPAYNVVTDCLRTAEAVSQMKRDALAHHPDTYRQGIGYSEATEAAFDATRARGDAWIREQSEHLTALNNLNTHTQKWVLQGIRAALAQHPETPLPILRFFLEEVGSNHSVVSDALSTGLVPRETVVPLPIRPEDRQLATQLLDVYHFRPNEIQQLGDHASFVQAFWLYQTGLGHGGHQIIDAMLDRHPEMYQNPGEREARRHAIQQTVTRLALDAKIQLLYYVEPLLP